MRPLGKTQLAVLERLRRGWPDSLLFGECRPETISGLRDGELWAVLHSLIRRGLAEKLERGVYRATSRAGAPEPDVEEPEPESQAPSAGQDDPDEAITPEGLVKPPFLPLRPLPCRAQVAALSVRIDTLLATLPIDSNDPRIVDLTLASKHVWSALERWGWEGADQPG